MAKKSLPVPGITVRHVDTDDSQAFGRTLEEINVRRCFNCFAKEIRPAMLLD